MPADSASVSRREQDNLRGVVLMAGGFAAFSCADMIAKVLASDFHPVQIVWTR